MSRKQGREGMRKIRAQDLSLEVVHPDAAGIDIGNESHYVAVPSTRDRAAVRCFGCTTAELRQMAGWLKQCGIRTVALQSTGVYWIAVYDILEEALRGCEACLRDSEKEQRDVIREEQAADRHERHGARVGFDWGDREHAWVIEWADTGQRERGRLEQTPEALDTCICQWMTRLNGRRMAVAIEQKHGAVVWMMLKYECVEIYPIHPQAAGQFRQALYPSGSKSDPTDAELLLELLVHHRDRLRPLEREDEPTRRLLMLVEQRRHWVEERKRHGNRLSARLKVYFPRY